MATKARKTRTSTANRNGGAWITPKRRLALYLRDRFLCIYCLRDLHAADPRDVTLDHLRCGHAAGNHGNDNLITACRSCNSSRRDLPLARFASAETRAHIRRNTRRSMAPYLRLAAAILAGEMGDPRG